MYPRNAASPPRIGIGAVVQIADGSVQSSGVSVVLQPEGGSETAGGGTVSYGATSGVVYYAPTQAETDYTAFVVTAYKTGCIPVSQTIVTSANAVPGIVRAVDSSGNAIPTTAQIAAATRDVSNASPAAGSLGEAVNDAGGGSTVVVQPLTSTINERVSESTIQAYLNENGWTIGPVVVTDADGDPVDLTTYPTLRLVIQTQHGTDLLVTTSVSVSGADDNQWSATGTSAVTTTANAKHKWTLWGIDTGVKVVLGRGAVVVGEAADVDA